MIVESFPENITCRGAVVFGKLVKQCHENYFNHLQTYFHDIVLSKATAPQ